MPSTVLLLGDITGRSRVAVRAMTAALEERGHEVLCLPTALISHTLNLGRAQTLDTTEYLLGSLEAWEALGIGYDCLCIGYVTGSAQARALAKVADGARARSILVLVDPILGDNGHMYRSVKEDQVEGMRLLCRHADVITPNLTEAELLTQSREPPKALAERLSEGKRSVLITGCPAQTKEYGSIVGVDVRRGEAVDVRFERVPGEYFGTGDLFGALLTDALLAGETLAHAAQGAARGVARAIAGTR